MNDKIGRRLKRLRTDRGLTQKELASQVEGGLDYTYIGKIERGEQLPSLKILLGLSEALGVPLDFFFQSEDTATVSLLTADLEGLLKQPGAHELILALRQLHPEDLPLVTEIIHVLNRHRSTAESSGKTRRELP